MKINPGKLLATVSRAAKNNPEIALAVAGLIAPKLVRKAAPLVPLIVAAARRKVRAPPQVLGDQAEPAGRKATA